MKHADGHDNPSDVHFITIS